MHLIEKYATSAGVKINKPEIYYKYFPVPCDRYILFCPDNQKNDLTYDNWQVVLDGIYQFLQVLNISVIQIGNDKSKKYNNCFFLSEETIDYQNIAYLVKNSELILGVDGIINHLASIYNKKIVSLYSNVNTENFKPYWGDKANQILLSPVYKNKPFYGGNKIHRNINTIYPESIIKSVLNLLNFKFNQMLNTIHIGNNFHNKTLDIIPDGNINLENLNIDTFIIRMDLSFNINILMDLLKIKKSIVVTDKPIDKEIIIENKKNIIKVVYFIKSKNDPDFVKTLKYNNINYILISELEEDEIDRIKINYMDYGLIIRKIKNIPDFQLPKDRNVSYRSSKMYLSSKGLFNSLYAWKNNLKNHQDVKDDDLFWEDLNDLYIFTIDNIKNIS